MTSDRQNRRNNENGKDEPLKELNELRMKVRLLEEDKECYVKTIEEQIIKSRAI